MNRSKQMNDFLQYWARVYMQNPNYPVDPKVISASLMEYGMTPQEKQDRNIKSMFSAWMDHFKGHPFLSVFHDNRQKDFLQFQSVGDFGSQHVKLYLTYPKDKMEYCVNKIFEFIASNRFNTESKVADRVRADSIVLRMTNYDDAIKTMDFINRDPELLMYAKLTNPFIMRNGKVGVSYDDNLSYNATLSLMLSQYFQYCRQNATLKKVDHRNFRDYVNAYLRNTFSNPDNLVKFYSLPEVAKMVKRFNSIGDCLVNYEHVLRLISMQLDSGMNMERYSSFYRNVKDYSKNRQMAEYYNQLLQNLPYRKNAGQRKDATEEIALINEYIEFARKKYDSDITVITYLKKYVEEGNIQAITRDGNFRERFQKGMTPQRAFILMQGNIESYVHSNIPEKQQDLKAPTISFAEELLQEYIDLARTKYGDANVVPYLNGYIERGLQYITKENNFRNRFLQYLPPSRLLEVTNQNIANYVQTYIRTKNQTAGAIEDENSLYDVFMGACTATYQKYGYNQLRKAIESGMESNYAYFTDGDGQYRRRMINISKEDFTKFCWNLLGTYGMNIGDIKNICDACADTIEQMVSVKNDRKDNKMIS